MSFQYSSIHIVLNEKKPVSTGGGVHEPPPSDIRLFNLIKVKVQTCGWLVSG